MTVLRRLPRWARRALLAANLAASLAVLADWWLAVWPNLAATWFQGSAIAALAVPVGAWLGRRLDERQEHVARRTAQHVAEHHQATRAHVTGALAVHAAAQNDRLDVITDQIAALHARLDLQQGGTP